MRRRHGYGAAVAAPLVCGLAALAAPAQAQVAPACALGTPPAVTFDGLRGRVPFGPPQIFSFVESYDDWELEGDIEIRMVDAATDEPFFEGSATVDDDLYVQLDLDDRPAAVGATYTQRNWYAEDVDGAAPGTTTCTMSLRRTVTGYRRILLPPGCSEGAYRPRRFVVACGDGNFQLRKLHWRRWDRAVAIGRGTAIANDCIPYCVSGTFHSYPVRVRASRIRRCRYDDSRYRYTRLRITYRGARPPGAPRSQRVRVICAPPI